MVLSECEDGRAVREGVAIKHERKEPRRSLGHANRSVLSARRGESSACPRALQSTLCSFLIPTLADPAPRSRTGRPRALRALPTPERGFLLEEGAGVPPLNISTAYCLI